MIYSDPDIERLFQRFESSIGKQYEGYRNHVYRVFFNCLVQDKTPANREKYAIAAVFHDLGIWTDHTIDYLEPSIRQVRSYLSGIEKSQWTEEISTMIHWHHKVSRYRGPFAQTTEVFRRADWIDVSLGILSFGIDKQHILENRVRFPNRGFHWFLVKAIFKNLVRRPLNPLPMFTR